MTLAAHRHDSVGGSRFRHEAVLYRGLHDLRRTVLPFVRDGLAEDESVMVAMLPDRVRTLRNALGADADRVTFVDMQEIGGNPARIIPEWRRFVDLADGRSLRGVGEPVWAGRREVELEECVLHESLLNVAFDDGPAWRLLCPYDAAALPQDVVDEVFRTHPVVEEHVRGIAYQGHHLAHSSFGEQLVEPPETVDSLPFGTEDLAGVRDVVRRLSGRAGIGRDTVEDLVLAAHELAANSIRHGGGAGLLSAWREEDAFVVEVRDPGRIADPLVGRELAGFADETGRGVWMANQLCDLVQVRSGPAGTVVRLFTWL